MKFWDAIKKRWVLRSLLRHIKLAFIEGTILARKWSPSHQGQPDFMIIGAQKAGTTSLYHVLEQHPDILTSPIKQEVHYFDMNYRRSYAWYRAHFPGKSHLDNERARVMDCSPFYLFHPRVPNRIHQNLPDVKLIALLRNPVDRAFSHYNHACRRGHETKSFKGAVEAEPERLEEERKKIIRYPTYNSHNFRKFSYLSRGLYVRQLKRYLQYFRSDQLLILQSERLFEQPEKVVKRVLDELNIRDSDALAYERYNRGEYDRNMDPDMRERLEDFFRPYNEELYECIGRSFDW
jgi:hypothetical protein